MIKNNTILKKKYKNINLIEANAGTGKTFLIIKLYLYFLLGIKKKSKKYSIKKILIITFTKNAKNELQKRFLHTLYDLYLACIEKNTKNKILQKILNKIKNFNKTIKILKKNLFNIHKISIFTIHKFCKIILEENNIIKNKFFIQKNEEYINLESTYDFWRKNFYFLNNNLSLIILKYWKNPNQLYLEIKNWIIIQEKYSINFKKKKISFLNQHQKNILQIQKFKKLLIKNYIIIQKHIYKKLIKKNFFYKKNLKKWNEKIFLWSKKKTINYFIPLELKYFIKIKFLKKKNNINKIEKKVIKFIKKIKIFLKKKFSIKKNILYLAIKKIKKIIKKKKLLFFSFENLISLTIKYILKDKKSLKNIRKKYPIAFIDEFQDTDVQQFKIFKKIYKNKKNTQLFLIGDPKQTIYSFRGANIFSYFKIKSKILKKFYLTKNWRSSKKLISNINSLFKNIKNPFVFKEIQYISSNYPKKSKNIKFFIKKESQPSITFHYQNQPFTSLLKYYKWAAKKCANHIKYVIDNIKKKKAFLKFNKKKKLLKIKNICILVNNSKESSIIQKYLKKYNIKSYYTSEKNNIFEKIEIKELFWILSSIINLSNEKLFLTALSTSFFNLNLKKIKKIKKNIQLKIKFIKKFQNYSLIWKKYGILNVIKKILLDNKINKKNFYKKKIFKILNIIKIGEILEKKSILRRNKNNLINWLKNKILYFKSNEKKYNTRIFNIKKSIQITTIYKSKGLSYPIVWIPFSSNPIKYKKKFIFHDKNFKKVINLDQNIQGIKLEKKEDLSEKIRLLYVGITRSIFSCNMNLSYIIKKKKKKKKIYFYKNVLRHLLNCNKKIKFNNIKKEINKIKKFFKFINFNKKMYFIKNKKNSKKFIKKKKIKKNKQNKKKKNYFLIWKNLSYTKIIKQNRNKNYKKIIKPQIKKNKKIINAYNFPKGKKIGIILHKLLKEQNFKKNIDIKKIKKNLKKNKINKKWSKILKKWIHFIIFKKIKKKLKLFLIKKKNILKETKFCLPLKRNINEKILYLIIKKNYKISLIKKKYPHKINLNKGIFTGSIDLIFKWKEKYYIADYKSDWLGKNAKFYTYKNLKKIVFKKKYYFQYYLYSVVIHRFLKKKIKNYNFKNNFGGIFYFFVRGISMKKTSKKGIFFKTLKYKKIKKINNFFFKNFNKI
ncbi:exodeoxyribonuclease V subunit beta [Buchnera aphidicola]|uniref:exodeoxyribonuclease V subunit beta n=1 Tax=Buchnera aphidicola TaxID=9 RepID=UPI003464AC60